MTIGLTMRTKTILCVLLLAGGSRMAEVRAQSFPPVSEPREAVTLYRDSESWIRERYRWFREQRLRDGEQVPEGAREAAVAAQKRMSVYRPLSKTGAALWTNVGPGNIGGRVTGIAIDPANPDLVYFTGADGGVWKSVNGGASFTPIADLLPTMSMGAITLSPSNPSVVLLGTGEANGSGDCYPGTGAYLSTDAGMTWNPAGSKFASNIAEVVIHATQPSIMLAAARDGLYRSSNGGGTWTKLRSGFVCDVLQHPTAPSVFYAAASGAGVLRSDDNGASWSVLNIGVATDSIGRIAIDLCRSAPQVLYGVIVSAKGSSALKAIVKSTNGGTTWVRTNTSSTPNFFGSQGWYNIDLAVDPSNAQRLLIGGVGLYLSTDGGTLWSSRSGIHVDHHAIRFSPSHPTICYVGNDGGMYKSTDGGTNFVSLNNNLPITQFYELGIHQTYPHLMIGGTQDNGTKRRNQSSSSWLQATGGDGGYAIIDPTDTMYVYAEYQNGSHTRSTDGGRSFTSINKGLFGNGPWVTPVAIHPVNTQVLFTCTNKQLYKTTNRGTQWFPFHGNMDSASSIRVICLREEQPEQMLVGYSNGKVWFSSNGGGSWINRSAGLPSRTVTDLHFDPTRDSVWYATFSGYSADGIFRTTNAGQTWTSITGNLPAIPKNALQVLPHDPASMFVGTDLGCYATTNGGQTWTILSQGMPNVVVADLEYQKATGRLRAATHGRSVYELTVSVPVELVSFTAEPQGERIRLDWRTASETHNRGFMVERRHGDEGIWTALGFVPAQGESGPAHYQFVDDTPDRRIRLWYRLRQIDEDGSEELSPVVSIDAARPDRFGLSAPWPQPAGTVASVSWTLDEDGPMTLSLVDQSGRTMRIIEEGLRPAGSHVASFRLDALATGTYWIRLSAGTRQAIRVLQRW